MLLYSRGPWTYKTKQILLLSNPLLSNTFVAWNGLGNPGTFVLCNCMNAKTYFPQMLILQTSLSKVENVRSLISYKIFPFIFLRRGCFDILPLNIKKILPFLSNHDFPQVPCELPLVENLFFSLLSILSEHTMLHLYHQPLAYLHRHIHLINPNTHTYRQDFLNIL